MSPMPEFMDDSSPDSPRSRNGLCQNISPVVNSVVDSEDLSDKEILGNPAELAIEVGEQTETQAELDNVESNLSKCTLNKDNAADDAVDGNLQTEVSEYALSE